MQKGTEKGLQKEAGSRVEKDDLIQIHFFQFKKEGIRNMVILISYPCTQNKTDIYHVGKAVYHIEVLCVRETSFPRTPMIKSQVTCLRELEGV